MSVATAVDLTAEQKRAVSVCARRIKAGEKVTKLFGYAGTGKTTIARVIADEVGGRAVFAAYTGKAASVLTQKGCPAQTIHSLFYRYAGEEPVKDGKRRVRREDDDDQEKKPPRKTRPVFGFDASKFREAHPLTRVLVLDEVSMVDEKMAREIMSAGISLLAMGDPAQLPPYQGEGYFTRGKPDAMLTEVVRNEGDVLRLATDVRLNGVRAINQPQYRDMVLPYGVYRDEALEFDQILTGRNDTRWQKNGTMRNLLGYDDATIAVGERIMCLRNNKQFNVLNGQQFRVLGVPRDGLNYSRHRFVDLLLGCECQPDNAASGVCPRCGWQPHLVPVWAAGFQSFADEDKLCKSNHWPAMAATYGYAITTAKAQGSEWGDVLIVNQSGIAREHATAWLYTAITRAQNSVTIIPSTP